MATLTLTPKTSTHGVWDDSLPTIDRSVVTSPINTFIEHTALGTLTIPNLAVGDKVTVRFSHKMTIAGSVIVTELRKADGTSVLLTDTDTMSTTFEERTMSGTVLDPNDWIGMRWFVKDTAIGGRTQTIQSSSIYSPHAPSTNITDLNRKVMCNSIYIYSLSGNEAIEGKAHDGNKRAFTEIVINNVLSAFVFSANSGNLLYDWDGNSIGVSP